MAKSKPVPTGNTHLSNPRGRPRTNLQKNNTLCFVIGCTSIAVSIAAGFVHLLYKLSLLYPPTPNFTPTPTYKSKAGYKNAGDFTALLIKIMCSIGGICACIFGFRHIKKFWPFNRSCNPSLRLISSSSSCSSPRYSGNDLGFYSPDSVPNNPNNIAQASASEYVTNDVSSRSLISSRDPSNVQENWMPQNQL